MLWKVAKGALKTKGSLGRILHREDEDVFYCPLCRQATKDTFHLFIYCSVASIAWRESLWAVQMDSILFSTLVELIKTIFQVDFAFNMKERNLRAFLLNAAIMMDVIWHTHNIVVHLSEPVNTGDMVMAIRRRYVKHAAAWVEVGRSTNLHWNPPQLRFLKLNLDIAVRSNGSYIAISVRDSFSSLWKIYMERLAAIDSIVGETFALAEGVSLACKRNWCRAVFECDSLLLCKDILSADQPSLWVVATL